MGLYKLHKENINQSKPLWLSISNNLVFLNFTNYQLIDYYFTAGKY